MWSLYLCLTKDLILSVNNTYFAVNISKAYMYTEIKYTYKNKVSCFPFELS